MTLFRIIFVALSMGAIGASWHLGRQGFGGESADIPSAGQSVRTGSTGAYYGGGRVK